MTDRQPRRVLISYVRENQDQVDRLCQDLKSHGVNVWLDRNSIKLGARWKDAIQEAIRQGDFFIACFSDEYTSKTKSYMNAELTLAINEFQEYDTNRERFIPILLSECDVPARSIGGGEIWGSSLRLTSEDITFNMFEAFFKFSILLQLCFHACNRAADRTVLI